MRALLHAVLDAALIPVHAIQHSLPAPVLVAIGCVALFTFGVYDYVRNSP